MLDIEIVGVKYDRERLEKIVTVELEKFAIFPGTLGFHYMREAIIYIIEERKDNTSISTKELYSTIAEKFDSSFSKIKKVIFYEIEKAFKKNRKVLEETIKEYFCFSYPEGKKPTNSEFLFTVAEYIRLNLL